jgi:hypothetical protein
VALGLRKDDSERWRWWVGWENWIPGFIFEAFIWRGPFGDSSEAAKKACPFRPPSNKSSQVINVGVKAGPLRFLILFQLFFPWVTDESQVQVFVKHSEPPSSFNYFLSILRTRDSVHIKTNFISDFWGKSDLTNIYIILLYQFIGFWVLGDTL